MFREIVFYSTCFKELFTIISCSIIFQGSSNQFWDEFNSNLTALGYLRSEALRQASYTYDAVWAAALALHNASIQLESGVIKDQRLTLEDYDYSRGDINNIILWAARGLKFRGVSVSLV